MEELKEALAEGDMEEVEAIAADIISNEDKVMHHGKRAEGIVKSMLQHSRMCYSCSSLQHKELFHSRGSISTTMKIWVG